MTNTFFCFRLLHHTDENNIKLDTDHLVFLNHTLKESLEDCILRKRSHCQWISGKVGTRQFHSDFYTYYRTSQCSIHIFHTPLKDRKFITTMKYRNS